MSLELDLQKRSGNACELCTSLDRLAIYEVKPTLTVVEVLMGVY